MKKIYFSFLLFIFTAVLNHGTIAYAADIKFRSPLSTFGNPVYTAFRDDDRGSGLKDYKCGTFTYAQHDGTDFNTSIGTQVYSSALGGAYYTENGCATTGSLSSTCGLGRYGNQVRIDHEGTNYADGRGLTTIYGHLEKGTVIGQASLLCAAKIGKTGSSGKASGPHLHFEVRTDGASVSTAVDPFSGACSQTKSYWVSVSSSSGKPSTTCQ